MALLSLWSWQPKYKQQTQKKQVGLHQTKTLFTANKTINKMKREPIEWEKIIANHVCDKGLIFKIYKALIQVNNNDNDQF